MFVTTTAQKQINQQRQDEFFDHYVAAFITEAQQLKLSKDDLIALIERGYQND
ncbi:Hypothetical protein LCA_0929 [Latilactobacillus sakei subsp. sakei 23K]|uniref:Uncharacterized protein n=2 Tax=Latilactobacillus sakei TaxID=1599 RepID=Q38X50_LATSS|nr:Hypothetical protein LCA_0929 [Latilactobacillus sakei subsp. sakei 23K]